MNKKERVSVVYAKFNGKCAYCGMEISMKEMQVDHIIPKSEFVSHVKNKLYVPDFLSHLQIEDVDHIDNLFPSCRVCNKWKSWFPLEQFRTELQAQLKRLELYVASFRIAKKYDMIKEDDKPIVFYFEK